MSFDLNLLSKYRTQLMGVAMIGIMFYHITLDVELSSNTFLYLIKRLGFAGVDIFMLVSGLGIYNSWKYSCNSRTSIFYKRRFLRIIPIYIIFISIYYTYISIAHKSPISVWVELVSTAHFWTSDPVSFWKFWYIPAILFMYLITPLFFKYAKENIIKGFFVFTGIALLIAALSSYFNIYEIYYSVMLPVRAISFLIGILIAYLIERKYIIRPMFLITLLILACITLIIYIYKIHEVWFVIPPKLTYLHSLAFWIPLVIIIPVFCIVLCKIFNVFPKYKFTVLAFFGTYSLSIYLWHQPIMQGMDTLVSNPYLSNLISFLLTIPVAYIFQNIVYKGIDILCKK